MSKKNKDKTKFKVVVFVHAICTGIYAGIQASHAAQELSLRCRQSGMETGFSVIDRNNFDQWQEKDKTYVFLNGGWTQNMKKIKSLVKKVGFPWAEFKEPDVGNMVTALAFVVPENYLPETIVGRKLNRLLFENRLAK